MKDFEEIGAEHRKEQVKVKESPEEKKSHKGLIIAAVCIFVFILALINDNHSEKTSVESEEDTALKTCISLRYDSERLVCDYLKAPKSAEFPDIAEWEFRGELGDVIYAIAYVDAQNGFGAMLREDFIIEYKYIDGEYIPICFSLGDEFVFDYRAEYGEGD